MNNNQRIMPGGGPGEPFLSCRAFILAIPIFLAPAIACGLENKDFDKYVSVSVQPWANWVFRSGPYLDYRLKPSVFTTVEISLEYKKYLKLLFDFDMKANDNFVGELADSKAFTRIAGMLGFKNFAVRAAWGQIEGEAIWTGVPIPEQPQSADVSTKYMELTLLYNWPVCSLGIMYQNYHMPIELTYGYEDDMAFNYYGAYFGMSTFTFSMNKFKEEERNGMNIWLEQNLSLGVALGEISEEARRRRRFGEIVAEDKRIGYGGSILGTYGTAESEKAAFSGSWQIIAGLCGGINAGNLSLGFGAGYDGFIQFYASSDYDSALIRHGATVRVYCSF
ncbi:MAG: hypothetical protein LBP80_04225 [Treponema sp.]|jgi:hypothetical protein|nr:hypothetical protein [Treponema sp.]